MNAQQEVLLRFFRDGDSKSKISRNLGVYRKTVRKYILEYLQEILLVYRKQIVKLIQKLDPPFASIVWTRIMRIDGIYRIGAYASCYRVS